MNDLTLDGSGFEEVGVDISQRGVGVIRRRVRVEGEAEGRGWGVY
jgi:hypothetical protein